MYAVISLNSSTWLLILLLGGCATAPKASSHRPNIVILYTDDQGYGDCSALNPQAKFETPNMDRMAREGVVFTDGHSAGSVCTPSRYALLTGRYAWRTPSGGGVLPADVDGLIEDGRTTIASLLRDRGYATAAIGKWHLGMQIDGIRGDRDWSARVADGPLQKGFDSFYGIPASMNFGVLTWFEDDRPTEPATLWTRKKFPESEIATKPLDYRMAPPYDLEPQTRRDIEVAANFVDEHVLGIITDRAVEYIATHRSHPFFLYVAFTSPHLPHCTAEEFRGTSGMGNYGDFMAETDFRVGQILQALERFGLAQDTLVVLTSDNGPENNYEDWARIYGHESPGGFRGGKRDVYEGGHRVPFLIRWPRVVAPNQVCNQPVGQVDLLATIADLVGTDLEPDQGEDSCSFLPLLFGEARSSSSRKPLIHHGRGQFAIRDGSLKLIFDKSTEEARRLGAPALLFNIEEDPAESVNLLSDLPEAVVQLSGLAQELVEG